MQQTRLILVRHGQTEWNATHRVQGHTDVPLDETGRAQAARLAVALASEPIDAAYASDLSRAIETAEAIVKTRGLTVVSSPDFREANYGEWEGMTVAEIEAAYPEEYRAWRRDSLTHRAPSAETLEELHERSLRGIESIVAGHPGATILLVAHGGSLRGVICGILGWPLTTHRQLRLDNTSISRIEYGAYGPILASFNVTSHLDD